ncbi:MAG TPA: hypothetical protein VNJ04_05190 [Gemmatimonadaceae bacterium]|nr:hypothetical protein [Gemmatimonadaceae bacterium]
MNQRLPLGSITSSAGIAASSLQGSDAITYDGHGLETGDPVTVRALEGGSLSAPLVEGTIYYAIRLSGARFKLSAALGGLPLDLTTDAVSMFVVREPSFDQQIEFYSRWADAFLPAHLVPLTEPIHPFVRGIVADLAAKRMLNIAGQESAILTETELASKAQLERFVKGLSLRGAPATASSNMAVTTSLSATTDSRGWGSGTIP